MTTLVGQQWMSLCSLAWDGKGALHFPPTLVNALGPGTFGRVSENMPERPHKGQPVAPRQYAEERYMGSSLGADATLRSGSLKGHDRERYAGHTIINTQEGHVSRLVFNGLHGSYATGLKWRMLSIMWRIHGCSRAGYSFCRV